MSRNQSDHSLFALVCTTMLSAQKENFRNKAFSSLHFRYYGQIESLAMMSYVP